MSASKRLSVELDKHGCTHPEGHRSDPVVGGDMAQKSGMYNIPMATCIVYSLCMKTLMEDVPELPTVKGILAHEEQGLRLAQEGMALVHKPLSRSEIAQNPHAKEALMKEADQMRKIEIWNENEVIEVDQLLDQCRKEGT